MTSPAAVGSVLPAHEPLAVQTRGDLVESIHYGSLIAVSPEGEVRVTRGDPHAAVYPRSALKPLFAVAMLGLGLELDSECLALACSSHSGSGRHQETVLRILDAAGLSRSDLRNVPDLPLGVVERQRAVSEGEAPTRLAQNCSGKHAAMLATCVVNGWSTENYLAPSHPLTATLRRSVATQTGDVVSATSIDGCGAEVQAVTLAGMARAFSRLVTAPQGSAERAVADAMRGHPELVGGEGRDVTALMRSVPGALAKDGAEGVQVIALADGGSVAAKAADGADRARMPCAAPGLIALGVAEASLAGIDRIPALGGGIEVGELRGLR